MKIAILTLPLHTNYGGILQAYALQNTLEKMGHEAYVLSYLPCFHCRNKTKKVKIILSYKLRIIFKLLPKRLLKIYYNKISNSTSRNLNLFIKLYIKEYYKADLNAIKQNIFDCFIVGSDQIWRPAYNGEIENSFLSFTKGWHVKRVAYAPSFGTDNWEYTEQMTSICKNLLTKFDAISVREQSGVSLCKQYFNIDSSLVLDPTLLLNKEEYIDLFKIKNLHKSKGNLLVYILDKSEYYDHYVKEIQGNKNLIPFIIDIDDSNSNRSNIEEPKISVECWIKGFYDAEFIITDSFHACVFSLIFNKPFIVLRNDKRGNARIDNLLSLFNQQHRIIYNNMHLDINDELFIKPNVNEIILKKQQESIDFLKKVL